jgi:hypothetical protein
MFTNLTNSVYLDEFIKAYMGSYFRKPIMPNSGSRKDCITLQQHEPILNSYEFCVISARCYCTPDRKESVWYSFTWRNSCHYHAGQKHKINFKYRLSNISPNCNSEVTGGITELLISCLSQILHENIGKFITESQDNLAFIFLTILLCMITVHEHRNDRIWKMPFSPNILPYLEITHYD